jgi:DNA-binding XRE family transcriptional regulator
MPKKRHISPFGGQHQPSRSEGRTRRLAVQKALGGRITQLRRKKKVSQEGFADLCSLHRSHMGQVERGQANVTLSTLLSVVEQLDTTVSELFNGIA